jgi:hypothetical protein
LVESYVVPISSEGQCNRYELLEIKRVSLSISDPYSPDIAYKETMLNTEKQKLEDQQKTYNLIIQMKKKYNQKIPYKIMSKLDLSLAEDHIRKIVHRKETNESALRIQRIFRGYLARRYYKLYLKNKLRLAINLQRIWRVHYLKIVKRRQDEQEATKKITLIQAIFRGCLTRMNWRRMMKERLAMNDIFFEELKVLHSQ